MVAAIRADYADSLDSSSVPEKALESRLDGGMRDTSTTDDHHPVLASDQAEPVIESGYVFPEARQSVLGSKNTPMPMEAQRAEKLRTPGNSSATVSHSNGTADKENSPNKEDVIEAPAGPHRGSEHHELVKRPSMDIIETPDARKRSRGLGRKSGVASVPSQSEPQAV